MFFFIYCYNEILLFDYFSEKNSVPRLKVSNTGKISLCEELEGFDQTFLVVVEISLFCWVSRFVLHPE